jgi:hypothetical protein
MPLAKPTSAWVKAGASFTPSPTMPTFLPCAWSSFYAREIAEANNWRRLATNSVKLVNILGGYGYQPILASMEQCVDAAISGKLS